MVHRWTLGPLRTSCSSTWRSSRHACTLCAETGLFFSARARTRASEHPSRLADEFCIPDGGLWSVIPNC